MSPELSEALLYLFGALGLAFVLWDINRVKTFTTKSPHECPEGRKDCPHRLTYRTYPGRGVSVESNVAESIAKGCCKFVKQIEAAERLCQELEAQGHKITRVGRLPKDE